MSITGSSSSPIYRGIAFNMTCTTNLTKSLDIPVTVSVIWKRLYCNGWHIYRDFHPAKEVSPNVFQSIIEYSPVCNWNGGIYSCTAIVEAGSYADTTIQANFSYSTTGKKSNLLCVIYIIFL